MGSAWANVCFRLSLKSKSMTIRRFLNNESIMSQNKRGAHSIWRGRWTFILAATGSAVGLGNIWKFPYMTGENGGGAFVLMYLLCILIVGVPVMMAEIMLGREGRQSPIRAMQTLAHKYSAPKWFAAIGWMGALSGFLILSFYSVIAGWSFYYIGQLISGRFIEASPELSIATLNGLMSSPLLQLALHSSFMLLTGGVLALGVLKGLERSIRFLMPMLFVMLLILLGYSMTTPGFTQGLEFLFAPDFSKLRSSSVIEALGHAFFTLSIGIGAIMAYGSYMPQKTNIGKTVLAVVVLDTVCALVAGMIIFPVVFSYGLEPSAGPGLLFQAIPLAFGSLPAGQYVGAFFFVLVLVAAWTSAISMAEPMVAWAVEKGMNRKFAASAVCGVAWILGFATILSFNHWSEMKIFGRTVFDNIDFLTASILMPLGGLLIALFVGWFVARPAINKAMAMRSNKIISVWLMVLRYLSPLAILIIFAHGLGLLKLLGLDVG